MYTLPEGRVCSCLQGVGHNPAREDCCAWHFAPYHYDMTRPLSVSLPQPTHDLTRFPPH